MLLLLLLLLMVLLISLVELVSTSTCGAVSVFPNASAPFAVDSADWNFAPSLPQPAAIFFAHSEADVICAVDSAVRLNLPISVRSGRHDFAQFSAQTGSAVIDVSNLTHLDMVPNIEAVDVGPGVRLFQLADFLVNNSRSFPVGSCPSVGVAGFVLGGGFGPQSRMHGMASDSLVEADVVTVDSTGRASIATHSGASAVLWALRGGGTGTVGVVTRLRLHVYALPTAVTWGRLNVPVSSLPKTLALFEKYGPVAADHAYTTMFVGRSGGSISSLVVGDLAEFRRVSNFSVFAAVPGNVPATTVVTQPWLDAVAIWGGCSDVQSCRTQPWPDPRSPLLMESFSAYTALPWARDPKSVAGIVTALSNSPTGGYFILDALGGAINRVPSNATAFVHRHYLFCGQFDAVWNTPSQGAASHAWLMQLAADVGKVAAPAAYRNYPNRAISNASARYWGSNLGALRGVQRTVDPQGHFLAV